MRFKMTAEDERGGTVMCNGRLWNSTDDWLQQGMLCRLQWTDQYVGHPETLMREDKNGEEEEGERMHTTQPPSSVTAKYENLILDKTTRLLQCCNICKFVSILKWL